jgi:phosphohistidine phosphatase SixA
LAAAAALLMAGAAHAQFLNRDAMVQSLRQGGYVIVMRHASSPREVPDKKTANSDNLKPERQLDAEGRNSATAMGKALRNLKIPIGEVFTSPTYRALETIKYAQLGTPRPVPELGENGASMAGGTEAQAAWLRKAVTQFPKGTNTILITHFPNIRSAFPTLTDVADGEALVFGPSSPSPLGRIKIEEWPELK